MRGIIVQGLGFGDCGKGAATDHLTRKYGAKLVVRFSGGCQASHRVVLPSGHSHKFSQFGAGTFAGASTYLAQPVIIDPLAIQNEAKALDTSGNDPMALLEVHPFCLVSTRIHKRINVEDADNIRHGTCGMGIGATRKYWIDHGQDAVFAEDLHNLCRLTEKVALLDYRHPHPDGSLYVKRFARELFDASKDLQIRSEPRLPLQNPATIIFEGAQGLLLDQRIGCHPHTTWSDVTPMAAIDLAEDWGCESVRTLGIVRCYMTRHGNGPLPTEDRSLSFDDPGNPEHPYQGKMRFGWLDLPLLKYAASHVKLYGLVVNCMDHVVGREMRVCTRRPNDSLWGRDCGDFQWREMNESQILDALAEIAPVKITADGPTWEHRTERSDL